MSCRCSLEEATLQNYVFRRIQPTAPPTPAPSTLSDIIDFIEQVELAAKEEVDDEREGCLVLGGLFCMSASQAYYSHCL